MTGTISRLTGAIKSVCILECIVHELLNFGISPNLLARLVRVTQLIHCLYLIGSYAYSKKTLAQSQLKKVYKWASSMCLRFVLLSFEISMLIGT